MGGRGRGATAAARRDEASGCDNCMNAAAMKSNQRSLCRRRCHSRRRRRETPTSIRKRHALLLRAFFGAKRGEERTSDESVTATCNVARQNDGGSCASLAVGGMDGRRSDVNPFPSLAQTCWRSHARGGRRNGSAAARQVRPRRRSRGFAEIDRRRAD